MNEPVEHPGLATMRYLSGLTLPSAEHTPVDWAQRRTTGKTYPGAERTALPFPVRRTGPAALSLATIGDLLGNTLGVTRLEWLPDHVWQGMAATTILPPDAFGPVFAGRATPSGGRLYPVELYLGHPSLPGLAAGVHHYAPTRHALERVATGCVNDRLLDALAKLPGRPCDLALAASTVFWRNGFKYREFSYRLGALDVGVVIGQALALAQAADLETTVHLDFDDELLNDTLGLDQRRESAYALLTMTAPDRDRSGAGVDEPRVVSGPTAGLLGGPERTVLPLAGALHAAAVGRRPRPAEGALPPWPGGDLTTGLQLPAEDPQNDLLAGIMGRRSAMEGYRPTPIDLGQLAEMLRAASSACPSDVPGTAPQLDNTLLYVAVQRVTGLATGLYGYHPASNGLEPSRPGETLLSLAPGAFSWHAAAFEAAVAFLLVADLERGLDLYGDRWYRMQNIEAGIVAQRFSLAAAGQGLAAHIRCDYVTEAIDAALRLRTPAQTTLTVILAGPPRGAGPVVHPLWVDEPRRPEEAAL